MTNYVMSGRPLLHFVAGALVLFVMLSVAYATELSSADTQFLAGYEKVRAALAADDLAGAKIAATDLGNDSAAITAADKLATARTAFAKLSEHAITLAKGQPGYYVVNCPMVKKDWVQTSDKISNPYAGKEMLTCGVVKK